MSIPRLSRVVDAIPSQGFNAYDRLHEDESKVKALQSTVPDFSHQIQTLKWIWQVVKHAWAYRETNDEYIPQVR